MQLDENPPRECDRQRWERCKRDAINDYFATPDAHSDPIVEWLFDRADQENRK